MVLYVNTPSDSSHVSDTEESNISTSAISEDSVSPSKPMNAGTPNCIYMTKHCSSVSSSAAAFSTGISCAGPVRNTGIGAETFSSEEPAIQPSQPMNTISDMNMNNDMISAFLMIFLPTWSYGQFISSSKSVNIMGLLRAKIEE